MAVFTHKEIAVSKSSLPDMTKRRSKEPFNPALEAPVALTPDQLEAVVGGLLRFEGGDATSGGGGTTTGAYPPIKTVSIPSTVSILSKL